MNASAARMTDVVLIEPEVFGDERGFFTESFNERRFVQRTALAVRFVQDNHSLSVRSTLSGLHYQTRQRQGKRVRVVSGSGYGAVVELRRQSPQFGKWRGTHLIAADRRKFSGSRRGLRKDSPCSSIA